MTDTNWTKTRVRNTLKLHVFPGVEELCQQVGKDIAEHYEGRLKEAAAALNQANDTIAAKNAEIDTLRDMLAAVKGFQPLPPNGWHGQANA